MNQSGIRIFVTVFLHLRTVAETILEDVTNVCGEDLPSVAWVKHFEAEIVDLHDVAVDEGVDSHQESGQVNVDSREAVWEDVVESNGQSVIFVTKNFVEVLDDRFLCHVAVHLLMNLG